MRECDQDDFSIALRAEMKSLSFQFGTDLPMIEYLAVEDDNNVLVWTEERLVASLKIEDTQPRCAQ